MIIAFDDPFNRKGILKVKNNLNKIRQKCVQYFKHTVDTYYMSLLT